MQIPSIIIFSCIALITPFASAAPPPSEYQRLSAEIETNLQEHVLGVWYPRSIDSEHGGFYENFSENWTRRSNNTKSIVCQSRLTWTASRIVLRNAELAEKYLTYANHGATFLRNKMWDHETGGFYWSISKNGRPSTGRGPEKHVYGNAFGIYSLATHFHASHDSASLDLAKTAFAWLEEHAHDSVNDGYFENFDGTGTPIMNSSNGSRDPLGVPYGWKSMNSHIHLLEAFAALYEVWPDTFVKIRLQEVFEIVRDRIVVAPGAQGLFFTQDWRPLPDHDSYGHDVETAYLLVEAEEILRGETSEDTWRIARQIVDHSLDYGWDTEHGGFFDGGGVFGPATRRDKVWWVQAEGLNALLLMHTRFGVETDRFWNAFLQEWAFISDHQIDRKHLGWFANLSEEGVSQPGANKGDAWTENYHQGRALMNVTKMLNALAEDQSEQ